MQEMTQALIVFLAGAVLSAVFTGIEIPILKKKQFGQFIREEGPESHQAKAGTPTMGGLIFVISTVITTIALVLTGKLQFTTNLQIVLFRIIDYY